MSRKLLYFDGSPFARILRILAREWQIPWDEDEITEFPFDDAIFRDTPFGQVPVLYDGDEVLFPTAVILRRMAAIAGKALDDQTVTVALQMGDALVAAKYQDWAGLGPVGANVLGFDPGQRNMKRVFQTLEWLEERIATDILAPEAVTVAVFLEWTDSRGPIPWRGNAWREELVRTLSTRRAFEQTRPNPWEARQ